MLICAVFNGLEREQVRDSVSPVNGSMVFSPVLYSGSAGVGKSCILCCSRRRRLSSSSCWATLVTASNWCSLSSFLHQATNTTLKLGLLLWVLSQKVFSFIISSAFLMNPPFAVNTVTHTCGHSCRSDFCSLPNKL